MVVHCPLLTGRRSRFGFAPGPLATLSQEQNEGTQVSEGVSSGSSLKRSGAAGRYPAPELPRPPAGGRGAASLRSQQFQELRQIQCLLTGTSAPGWKWGVCGSPNTPRSYPMLRSQTLEATRPLQGTAAPRVTSAPRPRAGRREPWMDKEAKRQGHNQPSPQERRGLSQCLRGVALSQTYPPGLFRTAS